jgi:S1-C subfamily serine protease
MRALLLSGVIVAAACSGGGSKTPANPKKPLTAKEIVQQSTPAIVFVEVTGEGDTRGTGTGFILDKTGLIATNFHVVAGMKTIKIKLYGGETYEVQQIAGIDPARDLAVLRIQPTKALPTVKLGNSDVMAVGDQVVTIGNPLGVFDYTVSAGLLSQIRPECTKDMVAFAKANIKRFEELVIKYKTTGKLTEAEVKEAQELTQRGVTCRQELTYFQFNAPISQGSSGGPLFNLAGEVIGVTTGIINNAQNINIAVPTNYLKPILANPSAISMPEFTAATKDAQASKAPSGDEDNDPWQITRNIPVHATNLLDGCTGDQIVNLENEIWSAIEIGAPLYNQRTNKGIEACFRVYEGTSNKFEQNPPCKGVKQAFADGLLRASSLATYKPKAWAMRDTFDGLLAVARKWRDANPGKWDPAKLKQKDKP